MDMHYKIGIVNLSWFFVFYEDEYGGYERVEGVDFTLLTILSTFLNFTYEFVQPNDNTWGILKKDGNWTGIMGMLKRKEVDMSINYLGLSYDRMQVSNFSFPYQIEYNTFVLKKAGTAPKTFYFAHPFELSVWGCIAVFLLLSSVVLIGLQRTNLSHKRKIYGMYLKSTITAIETLIGNHGFDNLFHRSVTRLFFAFSALPFRVLMFSFTGLLLSFLMQPIMEHQIETLEELAKESRSDHIKVLVFRGTTLDSTFKYAKEGIPKDLSKHIGNHPEDVAFNKLDLAEKILRGYGFMETKIILRTFVYEVGISEKVFIADDMFQLILKGILFRKDFCCIKDFDRIIHRIHESGNYQKIVQDLFYKLDAKAKSEVIVESPVKSIQISNLSGVFGLLLCGCALATIVLLCEICNYNSKKGKIRKSKKLLKSQRLRGRNIA